MKVRDCINGSFGYPCESTGEESGALDIWSARFSKFRSSVERFFLILSDDEKSHARRIIPEIPRHNYIISRGILRNIFSSYTNIHPAAHTLIYGPGGKPHLEAAELSRELFFNISHSGDIFMAAFSLWGPVGIDVQRIDADFDYMRIAGRFFHPLEYRALLNLPKTKRQKAFYRCWTLKESLAKAIGTSMWRLLDKFDASSQVGYSFTLQGVSVEAEDLSLWHLQEVPAPRSYCASLACKGKPHLLRFFKGDSLRERLT